MKYLPSSEKSQDSNFTIVNWAASATVLIKCFSTSSPRRLPPPVHPNPMNCAAPPIGGMSELEKGAVKAVQDLYDVVHHDILSMDLRKNYETWELLSNARTEGCVFAKLKWPNDRVVIEDMQGAQVKNCIHCVDALLNERPKRKDRFNLKKRLRKLSNFRKNAIINFRKNIRGKVGVAEIEGKMRENRFRRPTDAPVRRCDYGTEVQGQRGRGRPRKTLEETLRKDLEYLVLTEDMTQNRAQWRSRIQYSRPHLVGKGFVVVVSCWHYCLRINASVFYIYLMTLILISAFSVFTNAFNCPLFYISVMIQKLHRKHISF
ncbi:hypothetical protein DVH24_032950 [Malus domestica]|uniref:Uncharacterized protein n=1 Tax=Malus domestica TaxID=3750 RepID=A0A498IMT3_MALDO|nr:hypothetical protein DVH24_032950 [Malus domestica]